MHKPNLSLRALLILALCVLPFVHAHGQGAPTPGAAVNGRPAYSGRYFEAAGKLEAQLEQVISAPDGVITRETAEQIFAIEIPRQQACSAPCAGDGFEVVPGKDWYFKLHVSRQPNGAAAFSFEPRRAQDTRVEICLQARDFEEAATRIGWRVVAEHKTLLSVPPVRTFRKGRGVLFVNRTPDEECVDRVMMFGNVSDDLRL
ncbi:hypothetical protein QTH90_21675 [Variovorax sp. J2P1-59]|uniref:hypothetical protein n=1 Tax=Variovorax flavidus TaxID=3053501 RepID=UPI002575C938|nr:hypothetical protein [Variovorax sp. J2P1-59]MDM0077035.1 hypothetical protein [Variovorax sp. J2P1-59]